MVEVGVLRLLDVVVFETTKRNYNCMLNETYVGLRRSDETTKRNYNDDEAIAWFSDANTLVAKKQQKETTTRKEKEGETIKRNYKGSEWL